MTKLRTAHWAHACILTLLSACGSETGSTPSPTGEAGADAPVTTPSAGSAGTTQGTAGTATASAGRGGSTATGSAGAPGAAGSGGAGGATATAGTSAQAGTGGAAAGAGGAEAIGGTGAAGTSAEAGSGGAGGEPAAGSGADEGGDIEPPEEGALNETFVVPAGKTLDAQGRRYTAGPALGDGSQSEDQQPVFKLEPGATLLNVVLGGPAADGIHCHGDATLRNIVWDDIGEDALTIKGEGTVKLDGGSARNGDDKVFQVNAASRFEISNFKASNAGKFIRQNGGTDFKVEIVIDKCDISNMKESIFRTDSDSSTVEMTNTRYSNIGKELFMGVSSGNIKTSNNTEY